MELWLSDSWIIGTIIIIVSCIGFNLIWVYKEINSEGKIMKENEFYNNLETH